jgi:hypothetical protein
MGMQRDGTAVIMVLGVQERVVGGLAPPGSTPNGGPAWRNSLSSRWESGEGWQAGYSALIQSAGAQPVQEVLFPSLVLHLSAFNSDIPTIISAIEKLNQLTSKTCRALLQSAL